MTPTITNIRAIREPETSWYMRRVVGGCQHSIVAIYTPAEPRDIAARRLRTARRMLHVAVEQQRDAIRIQQQTHY